MLNKQTVTDGKRWYLSQEMCDYPTKVNKIERRIYDDIITLRGTEHLSPTKTDARRKKFLSKISWIELLLKPDEKTRVEHLLVNFLNFLLGSA